MIGPLLKTYVLCVATRRETFSAGFTATDDAAAQAHAARWLARNPVSEDGSFRILCPDGRVVAARKGQAPAAAAIPRGP